MLYTIKRKNLTFDLDPYIVTLQKDAFTDYLSLYQIS
jgi:hypothetical protein